MKLFFNPLKIKEVKIKEKESLSFIDKKIDEDFLQNSITQYKKLPSVKKLNLQKNNIQKINNIFELFPNTVDLLLGNTLII